MTHEQYIDCLIACLVGNLLHVAMKILSLSKDYKKANMDFSILSYIKDDKYGLITDLGASFILVFLADEWMGDLGNYAIGKMKSIFVFVGFSGSYVILQMMSVAKEKFRKAVDEKSNIADGVNQDNIKID